MIDFSWGGRRYLNNNCRYLVDNNCCFKDSFFWEPITPISDCEVRDPRIRRTRQLLQNALRELLKAHSLEDISVQEITEAATVNRATFYDHYTDKFALLEAMVAGGFHLLLQEREVRFDGTCLGAVSAVILAVCDYLTQTHQGSGTCEHQRSFEPLMEAAITAAIRRVLLEGVQRRSSAQGLTPEMIATTTSWAIYGAVKEWFYTPEHVPAEKIVPVVLELVLPILQAGELK